jgi:dipeptidyl aminopeptidase/acylaminoacyl peptidase
MDKLLVFIQSLIFAIFNRETATLNQVVNTENAQQQISQQTAQYQSPIDINYLRTKTYESPAPVIEQELPNGSNYKQYIASYQSQGNKIYGLLTVPTTPMPEGGYSAIVFNHGYVPPTLYSTTERYVSYVDSLARNGFVVFKIDMRGHGRSQGRAGGSYFSSGYMTDALSALSSLQKLDYVNDDKIGMWGHSMAGNLVLRAMLVSDQVKAGVIWAGAVYSYEDFGKYRISDNSYRPPTTTQPPTNQTDRPDIPDDPNRESSERVTRLRQNPEEIDFSDPFWKAISLTQNLQYLNYPIQLHHAVNDSTVNIGYSRDLAKVLEENGKEYEFYEYQGGEHDIESPYFDSAMQRTIDFFKQNL